YALFYHLGVAVIVPGVATLAGLPFAEIVNAILAVCSALIALWLASLNGVDLWGPQPASAHTAPPRI
ncbi:MAG: hypothetical protein ACP5G7_01660, partial [Anaerolineae bacterium]